jgi:hypothetical protein
MTLLIYVFFFWFFNGHGLIYDEFAEKNIFFYSLIDT